MIGLQPSVYIGAGGRRDSLRANMGRIRAMVANVWPNWVKLVPLVPTQIGIGNNRPDFDFDELRGSTKCGAMSNQVLGPVRPGRAL